MSKIYQIRISLKNLNPPIWRRVLVQSDITLGRLHYLIQLVMGWTDSHLHQFILSTKKHKPTADEMARQLRRGGLDETFYDRMAGRRVFVQKTTPWGDDSEMDGEDEDAVTLAQVCPKAKSKLTYEYDFGDGWRHVIEVQKIVEPEPGVGYPVCQAGKRACPPEDCGGPWGYGDLLAAIDDPGHEQHEELLDWLGGEFDPGAFDLEAVNAILAKWRKK